MAYQDESVRLILACVYDLYRRTGGLDLPRAIATTLARAIPCDSAWHITIDPVGRSLDAVSWPAGVLPAGNSSVLYPLHERDHPAVAHYLRSRDTRAWRLSDLGDEQTWRATALYREIYRPLNIEQQLVMLLPSPDRRVRVVALSRRAPAFSDSERLLFELFWPHLALAGRMTRRAGRRGEQAAVGADGERRGIIVVRGDGRVSLCSESARVWLREYFGTLGILHRVELPELLRAWLKERWAAERTGHLIPPTRRDPLIIAKDDRCLVIRLILDQAKDEHLLVLDEELLAAPPASLEALGLTGREAEVLAWVAQGKTNREIGMILGASARTVQKHLEHVFQKIGVETRTAAILRAWQAGRYALLAPR
jgi:DNA-binding CsgD family transcriptional regulator